MNVQHYSFTALFSTEEVSLLILAQALRPENPLYIPRSLVFPRRPSRGREVPLTI